MKQQRRKHSAKFKAMIAFEAIKGLQTVNEIAAKHQIHPVQVSTWKKEMLENAEAIFQRKNAAKDKAPEREKEQLQRKVGQLTMEVDFLEKKCVQLGIALPEKGSGL